MGGAALLLRTELVHRDVPVRAGDRTGSRAADGEALSSDEIAERATAGDQEAQRSIELHASRLARALGTVINVLDPDAIVLGGGVSNIEQLYELVPARLGPHVFSDVVTTPIVRAQHGDSSGVRGAAWLWHPDEVAGGLPTS